MENHVGHVENRGISSGGQVGGVRKQKKEAVEE